LKNIKWQIDGNKVLKRLFCYNNFTSINQSVGNFVQ